MPPQIKQDLNQSGWESTDFPSVCENCLPQNPYVKMLKEDFGAECKLCTRPFTCFSWAADRAHGRKKRTTICLTCARLKNACQSCIMDLQFGLPIVVRDKALQLIAPGPQSDVNREFFAQNNERALEEGTSDVVDQYQDHRADEKARELLRKLAQSKPYFRKGRALVDEEGAPLTTSGEGANGAVARITGSTTNSSGGNAVVGAGIGGPGPIRSRDSRAAAAAGAGAGARQRGGRSGGSGSSILTNHHAPPGPKDWQPPADPNIMSLFLTGVEDDLPEFKLRDFFKAFGKLRSLVVSHMSHCAFVNYETREGAERAAAECKGRAVIAGCPLRVRWGQPRAIGTMDREERTAMIRDGRSAFPDARWRRSAKGGQNGAEGDAAEGANLNGDGRGGGGNNNSSDQLVAAPPGAAEVQYASMAGN